MEATQTDHGTQHAEAHHPPDSFYVKVALWLGLVTAIEIAVSYIDIPDWAIILSLVVLGAIKFIAVVAYFMHLKYDDKLLRKPFIAGIVTALAVYTIVLLAFKLHN